MTMRSPTTLSAAPRTAAASIILAVSVLGGTGAMAPVLVHGSTLLPPTQELPAAGATDMPTTVSIQWYDFHWYPEPKTYRAQISRNSGFTDLILDVHVPSAYYGYTVFNLTKGETYYWRVNLTSAGQTSSWSPVRTFTITDRQIAGVPSLVAPANGATGVPRTPTLVWTAVEGADSYDVQVGSTIFYATKGTSVTLTEQDLDADYSDHHIWRVRSRNPAGLGAWSEAWSFRRVIQ